MYGFVGLRDDGGMPVDQVHGVSSICLQCLAGRKELDSSSTASVGRVVAPLSTAISTADWAGHNKYDTSSLSVYTNSDDVISTCVSVSQLIINIC